MPIYTDLSGPIVRSILLIECVCSSDCTLKTCLAIPLEAWVWDKDSFKVCRLLPNGSREVMPDAETAAKVRCRGIRISEEEAGDEGGGAGKVSDCEVD